MTRATRERVTSAKQAAERKSAKKAGRQSGSAKAKATPAKAGGGWSERGKGSEGKPIRNLKEHAKKLIAKQFSEIMESMAEKSKAGSLAHAKFLFEIGGVKEDLSRAGRGKAEPSLADLLMGGVKLRQAANAAELERRSQSGDEEDEAMGEGAADR